MIIEYSEKDLLQSRIVEPAFYLVEITGVEEKADKSATGINAWIKGKILRNDDTGDEKFKDVPTPFLWLFSSKAPWSTVGFMSSLGANVAAGERVEISQNLVGRKVVVFIGNGVYNDQTTNVIDGRYRKPKE